MFVQAFVMAFAVLAAFYIGLKMHPGNVDYAQTMAFVTISVSQLFMAVTSRSDHYSIFSIGIFSNKWMVWAFIASFVIVLITLYVPFLNPIFDTKPLNLNDWFILIPFIILPAISAEIVKIYLRLRAKNEA